MFNLHCVGNWVCVLESEPPPSLPAQQESHIPEDSIKRFSWLNQATRSPGDPVCSWRLRFLYCSHSLLGVSQITRCSRQVWDLICPPPLQHRSLVYLDSFYSFRLRMNESLCGPGSLHGACHLVHGAFGHPEYDSHIAAATHCEDHL